MLKNENKPIFPIFSYVATLFWPVVYIKGAIRSFKNLSPKISYRYRINSKNAWKFFINPFLPFFSPVVSINIFCTSLQCMAVSCFYILRLEMSLLQRSFLHHTHT